MQQPKVIPWHVQLGLAAGLGALGAVGALIFVALMSAGQSVLWPDDMDPGAFSGSVRIVLIMTAAGVLVGLIHTVLPAEEPNVFQALAAGTLERRTLVGAILIALVTLVSGFSLGPEVPTGMVGGGLAGWVAARRGATAGQSQIATRAAITGAWGGLFTAPFTAVLLNVELNFERTALAWSRVTIDAIAAIVGFAVFFAVTASWSDVLRLIDLAPYTFELWHLVIATVLGILGAILGTFFKLVTLGTRRLAAPLADHPVVRCTIAGLALGLLGMALPLTLFLGTEGLVEVTDDPLVLGTGLVFASVIFKLVATSTALSFGFVGGPVFPLLFAGGGMGAVIHDLSPDIPIALAVTSMMVAVPASVIPIPFSLATLTVLIASVGPTEASGVFVAAIVALVAGRLIESAIRRSRPTAEGAESNADE